MTLGRPKKTIDSLPEGWQDEILALAAQGASDVEFRGLLDISNDLFYRWLKEEPIFSETINKAHDLCEIWWVKNGRLNLDSKEFNSTLWYMNMKNRFGWADKQEQKIDHTTKGEKISSIPVHSFVGGED